LTTLALAIPEISLGAQKFKMGHATLTTPLLGSFVLRMLELDIAYWLITLASAVPDSRDMVGAHQNLNGSRDLTTPLSG